MGIKPEDRLRIGCLEVLLVGRRIDFLALPLVAMVLGSHMIDRQRKKQHHVILALLPCSVLLSCSVSCCTYASFITF